MATVEQPTIVSLTESAAAKIRELMAEEPEGEAVVLRVAVQGGGCSGFQYALGFDRGPQEGDNEVHVNGVDVVVDPFSAPYLAGTQIDWVDGLQAGFAINNPNVSASCGCGHSFQVEEGETPEGEAAVLRIAVQGGGCSGFQYALGFDRGAQEGDNEVHVDGIDVVVDPFSAPYLAGTEIDWVEGLQAGFAINNPNVTASCGCGHSFQVEEGEAPESAAGCGSGCSH